MRIISPCSVTRRAPCTEPGGCERSAWRAQWQGSGKQLPDQLGPQQRNLVATLGDDPLGEILRGARDADVAPEVLLRIL